MNNKQQKILNEIFKRPITKSLKYKDLESLFKHLGCTIKEGNGSRVRIVYAHRGFNYHRPHPNPTVHPHVIKDARAFLELIGVKREAQI